MNREFTIREIANQFGVSVQTLRRWDQSGRFVARRKKTGKISRYRYDENMIEDFLSMDARMLLKIAEKWAFDPSSFMIPQRFYCADKSIFKARLSRFEYDLRQNANFAQRFPLIVAIAGEIGNNSYDHNLGNWSDVAGTFFGYNIAARNVILADRGQGLLQTLKRVRPVLASHAEALKVAFTEFVSGRAPEARGNGLKYVKEVISKYGFTLSFQTGDAILSLGKGEKDFKIAKAQSFARGVFTLISF